MLTINIHEAKTHLSRFIEKVAAGEEIIIAKAGKPIARLVPLHSLPSPRTLGMFKGQLKVPEDFDAALPEDVTMLFQNGAIEPSSENL
jgi:prevent-host-death family protein